MEKAIIILGHGSRYNDADSTIRAIVDAAQKGTNFDIVTYAFLQHSEPRIEEVLQECVVKGAHRIVIVPFFLQSGGHVRTDIPALVAKARSRYPGVTIETTELVGAHPLMQKIVIELAQNR